VDSRGRTGQTPSHFEEDIVVQRRRLASLAVAALALGGAVAYGAVQAGAASAATVATGNSTATAPIAPPPIAPPPPVTPPPPGGRCPLPWSPSTIYLGAALVSHGSHSWTAWWWTQGEAPGTSAVWKDNGFCVGGADPTTSVTSSPTVTPSPSGSTPQPTPGFCTQEPYSASKVYTQGLTVAYAGRVYTARWWTLNDQPGTAEVWRDKGPC
jgi:chitinase